MAKKKSPGQSLYERTLAYERRGLAKYALKDYAGAMRDFNTALRYSPKDGNTLSHRGLLKIDLGEVDSGMSDFAKYIRCAGAYKEFAYTCRGCGYIKLKKYKRAIADFNRAVKINPKFVAAYNNRGYCKYFLGDLKGAQKDCDKAHSLDKSFPKFKNARKIFEEGRSMLK